MNKVRIIPHEGDRVETGAVQFGNDWPGLFIRGDSAFFLAHDISAMLEYFGLDKDIDNVIENTGMNINVVLALTRLKGLEEIIKEDVVISHPNTKED